MGRRIESDSIQQRTEKMPVHPHIDRRKLLPGPFAVTDGNRQSSEHELSRPLSEGRIMKFLNR